MGLDIYFYRTFLVKGITPEQYAQINEKLNIVTVEPPQMVSLPNLETLTNIPGANQLLDHTILKKLSTPDEYDRVQLMSYYTIFEEIGYYRGRYYIKDWFVENLQGGEDLCGFYFLTPKVLSQLIHDCMVTINNPGPDHNLIPYSDDDGYYETILDLKLLAQKILDTTQWETQRIIYHSSW
jgi:hypothetical protein